MTSSVAVGPWITREPRITCNHVKVRAQDLGSEARCSVLLDPIPSVLLDSISVQGSCSVSDVTPDRDRAQEWEESLPMISDNEVQGLLQDLVDEDDDEEGGAGGGKQIDDNDVSGRQLRRRLEPETKRRKRSTSTSSSACSATSRRHRHKHRRRRHHRSPPPPPPPRPRVNPIFVWVKQDENRIVEVHCEEYDKRNRIRLTKTSAGWRAIPRTERCHVPTEPACSAAAGCSQQTVECSSDQDMPLAMPDPPDELMETEGLDAKSELMEETVPDTLEMEQSVPDTEEDVVTEQVDDSVVTEQVDEDSVMTEHVDEDSEMTEHMDKESLMVERVEVDSAVTEHLVDDAVTEHLEDEALTDHLQDDVLTEHLENDVLTEHVEDDCAVTEPVENDAIAEHVASDTVTEQVEDCVVEQAEPTDLTLPKSSSPRPTPRSLVLRPPPAHAPHFLEALLTSPHPHPPPPAAHAANLHPPAPAPARRPRVKRDVDDDITLRNLLSRRPKKEEKSQVRVPRKSRLLELLTSEPRDDLDPLTQLKKILSDPDMAIPDPLLVPRDRLQELVTCPAKEIPRLLTLRPELRLPEALAYPGLLQDPNLLVVSISYLQSLLRSPEKRSAQPSLLQWQQECNAQALSQMMWLSQLEAQAMFNNAFPMPADVHAMAMWQEAMMAGMMPPPPPPPPPPPTQHAARTYPHVYHQPPRPSPPPPKKQMKTEERCRPTVKCKPLLNLLSSPRREEEARCQGLKVKQHLVDPTLRPKLLKQEMEAELGDEKVHANLWHPLFGSQKASYNSPWQWTTVTVNGE